MRRGGGHSRHRSVRSRSSMEVCSWCGVEVDRDEGFRAAEPAGERARRVLPAGARGAVGDAGRALGRRAHRRPPTPTAGWASAPTAAKRSATPACCSSAIAASTGSATPSARRPPARLGEARRSLADGGLTAQAARVRPAGRSSHIGRLAASHTSPVSEDAGLVLEPRGAGVAERGLGERVEHAVVGDEREQHARARRARRRAAERPLAGQPHADPRGAERDAERAAEVEEADDETVVAVRRGEHRDLRHPGRSTEGRDRRGGPQEMLSGHGGNAARRRVRVSSAARPISASAVRRMRTPARRASVRRMSRPRRVDAVIAVALYAVILAEFVGGDFETDAALLARRRPRPDGSAGLAARGPAARRRRLDGRRGRAGAADAPRHRAADADRRDARRGLLGRARTSRGARRSPASPSSSRRSSSTSPATRSCSARSASAPGSPAGCGRRASATRAAWPSSPRRSTASASRRGGSRSPRSARASRASCTTSSRTR